MYKNILQHIDNIQVWPMVSLFIFFAFFLCLLWWTFTADKNLIDTLKHLPIDEKPSDNTLNS